MPFRCIFCIEKKTFEWQNSAIKHDFLQPLHLLGPFRSLCSLWSLSAQDRLACYGCQWLEASSREQWRLIRLCGCADWSVFTGRPYRKNTLLVCLLLLFSFPTINVPFSLMLGKSLWYALVRICYITEHILPTTPDATVDLSLSVTWIERSLCMAPRGSADRRELTKYEHIL